MLRKRKKGRVDGLFFLSFNISKFNLIDISAYKSQI